MLSNREPDRRRTAVSLLFARLVFTVKYRRRVISARVLNEIVTTIRSECEDIEVICVEVNGELDHLHLMLLFPPKIALSKIVQRLKARSSRAVRARAFPEVLRRLRGDHFWSPSYFVASCGGAPLDLVRQYIQRQNAAR